MGRPESKIPGDGPVADLARFLRTLRQQAGQTLRPMADRTTYSVSTLSRAANGLHVPSNDVLNEYVRLCDGGRRDQAEAHRLWVQARLHKARPRRPQPRTCTPVTAVTSPADLIAAMHDVRLDAGGPSLRDLEGRAGKLRLVLPRSTVSDALRGQADCRAGGCWKPTSAPAACPRTSCGCGAPLGSVPAAALTRATWTCSATSPTS